MSLFSAVGRSARRGRDSLKARSDQPALPHPLLDFPLFILDPLTILVLVSDGKACDTGVLSSESVSIYLAERHVGQGTYICQMTSRANRT